MLVLSRASLWSSAAFVACVLALVPTTALAYNGDNNGHHYGQLKHHKLPPPNPGPGPTPVPNPPPGVPPTTAGGGSAGTTGSGAGGASTIRLPQLNLIGLANVSFRAHAQATNVKFSRLPVSGPADQEWLVLLLLPALLAIWLLLFARATLAAARRRRRPSDA